MENRLDEASGQLRRLHNSEKPFYCLFFFIIIIISSLSLPFRSQSFSLKFTNFLDTNDRHYIFVLCNGILFFLFLASVSNQAGPEAKKIKCNKISVGSVYNHKDSLNTHDQVQDLETELVLHVDNEHELATEVKQIEQNEVLVDVHYHHDDRSEDLETESVLNADDEHEIVPKFEVKEEEHDDKEEANEFQQKCEAFIRKVKQSMHHEGCPYRPYTYPMIDSQESAD